VIIVILTLILKGTWKFRQVINVYLLDKVFVRVFLSNWNPYFFNFAALFSDSLDFVCMHMGSSPRIVSFNEV
jgi:hypothetical protein